MGVIVTHAQTLADNPGVGVSLFALLNPPVYVVPVAATINILSNKDECNEEPVFLKSMLQARIDRFRPVMQKKGKQSEMRICKRLGIESGSARGQLKKLIHSCHVDVEKNREGTLVYWWIG